MSGRTSNSLDNGSSAAAASSISASSNVPVATGGSGAAPALSVNQVVDLCLAEQTRLQRTRLSQDDLERVAITFSGQTSACFVCPCLVSVFRRVVEGRPDQSQAGTSAWKLAYKSGVLVLIMPSFEPDEKFAKSELMLVHPTACLPLWSLSLNSASRHSQMHMFFQTVADTDGATAYGLGFLDSDAASEFASRLSARLIEMAEFEASSLKERRRTFKERERRSKSLRRMLSRSKSSTEIGGFSEISRPCICQRLVSATAQDCDKFAEILNFADSRTEETTGEAAGGGTSASAFGGLPTSTDDSAVADM